MSKSIKVNSKKTIISDFNAGENINFKDGSSDRSHNKYTDNSKEITKVTHKHFKKSKKKNSIPKHEQPTFDNGGFIDKIDEFYEYQQLEPEYDISFIRPNLELLYEEQKSVSLTTMFAYVNKVGSSVHIMLIRKIRLILIFFVFQQNINFILKNIRRLSYG
jgi:hypothetical protein